MEAAVSRKRRKLAFGDDANGVELESKHFGSDGHGHVNAASTASDPKADCVSEADMLGFRDEDEDEDIMISGAGKRRKLGFEYQSRDVNFNENVASTTSFSGTSDHVNSIADLKAVCASKTDKFVFGNDCFSNASASSVVCFESEEMEASSTSTFNIPAVVVMPSAAELEEFFVKAEKYERKRFVEKYNFDIMKDVPMEGRYQWLPLNP